MEASRYCRINQWSRALLIYGDVTRARTWRIFRLQSLARPQRAPMMLKHGWTTVRVMGDVDVFYGVLDVRRAIEKGCSMGQE